jgi:hypothetical protein
MGTMPESDQSPPPHVGEVFFDIRGNSRSMRVSWYADSPVAVLSIWQGGVCTVTFRVAAGDLPRLIDALERGPGGRRPADQTGPPEYVADQPGGYTPDYRNSIYVSKPLDTWNQGPGVTPDYSPHYRAADSDDIGYEPGAESFPYSVPPGSHHAGGGQAGRDAPFD